MAELDDEILERVRRFCAEAGREAGPEEIRAALAPLSREEFFTLRALVADPPPARPLGPSALADIARGTPVDLASEREREGRYRPEREGLPVPEPSPSAPAAGGGRGGNRPPAPPVVRRKHARAPPSPPPEATLPPLDQLRSPGGRAVLERLLREHGARRSFLLSALARWRRADGAPPDDLDLEALLEVHGLSRAFAHRERAELLHALRAARGEWAAAARQMGMSAESYRAALQRVGAAEEAERIRDGRRAELRRLATLTERSRLFAREAEFLLDLGLLAEVEGDLRSRLPEHLRALRASGAQGSLAAAFARSLALPVADALALADRLGLSLGDARSPSGPPARKARGDPRPLTGSRPRPRPFRRGAPPGGRRRRSGAKRN
ncbi:MAG TPA: Fis family transcriptional regulator [Anaeromyxobacter sp.]|nr:Fis family transcriptional regulator [Anaeromyxobacter sp.]